MAAYQSRVGWYQALNLLPSFFWILSRSAVSSVYVVGGALMPAEVLVLDLDAGVRLLHRRVGCLHQLGPVVLRVDGEPDGQLLGVGAAVRRALVVVAPARRDGDHHARDTDRGYQLALHATLLRDATNPPASPRERWAGTWTNGVDQ